MLDRAGTRPRLFGPADRPRPDDVRAGRAVQRDGGAAGGGGEVGHRGVGADVHGRAPEERGKLRPVKLAVEALHWGLDPAPHPIEVGALGRIGAAGRDHLEP